MKFQVSQGRKVKGEPRRNIRSAVRKATLEAESPADESLLADLFKAFTRVGAGGLALGVQWIHDEIAQIDAQQEGGAA